MAKILFGVGVADARNALGGHVFSKNRNGAYVRQKVSPSQPRTVAQQAVRNSLATFSKAWGSLLNDTQRAAWVSLAASNPVPDQFGNPQILTGMQMYMRVNRNLHTIGQARKDAAPMDQAVDGITSFSIAGAAGAHTLILTFTPSPTAATGHLVFFATPGMSPGKNFVTSFLRLVFANAGIGTASGVDRGPDWEAKFGQLTQGQKVTGQIVFISDVTGAASGAVAASCIVAA